MPLVSMRQLLDHAAECGYGIPAFNVNNLEQVQALLKDGSLQADGKNIATYDYNGGVTRGMVHKAPAPGRGREHPDDIAWIKRGQGGGVKVTQCIKEIDGCIPNIPSDAPSVSNRHESEIQDAVKHGVRKINIGTDIRLVVTSVGGKSYDRRPAPMLRSPGSLDRRGSCPEPGWHQAVEHLSPSTEVCHD